MEAVFDTTIRVPITTKTVATGVNVDADSLPVVSLYLNGSATAMAYTGETVVNRATAGNYVVPIGISTVNGFAIGDYFEVWVTATVAAVEYGPEPLAEYKITANGLDSLATPTNITAGTITNLTNAPIAGDLTPTMKASVTTAATAATPTVTAGTVSDKTGYALSTSGVAAIWNALTSGMTTVGSIGKKLAAWVVGTIDTYTGNTKQTADHTAAIAAIPTLAAIVDGVLDEPVTGATHNVPTSLARRIQTLTENVTHEGTAQAGTVNSITLDVGASAVDNHYDPGLILITEGTGEGQSRFIIDYEGDTKVATVAQNWRVNPAADSVFVIFAAHTTGAVQNEGVASGGSTNTITLNPHASSITGTYRKQVVVIVSGTGFGESGLILAYDGDTKVATIAGNWVTQPDATSGYMVLPAGPVSIAAVLTTEVAGVDDFKADVSGIATGTTGIQTDLDNTVDGLGALKTLIEAIVPGGGGDATAANQAVIINYVDSLETRLTAVRAGLLDNLDIAISTRLATAGYMAPDNSGIVGIQTDLDNTTDGLGVLRTALQTVQDAMVVLLGQSANFTELEKQEFYDILGITGTGTSERPRAGIFEEMTEVRDGFTMFTSKALEMTYRIPSELDIIQIESEDAQVTIIYQITKTLAYVPSVVDNIVQVNIYRSINPLEDPAIWELHKTVAYVQGDTEVTYSTEFTGYFKMAFQDNEGNVGELSATFSVNNELIDVDLKFKLEKDSLNFIVGDQRYLTIKATDRDKLMTTLPAGRMTVVAPDGTTLIADDVSAVIEGMYVKYLLVTDELTPGTYKCRCKVLTNYEVIQSDWFSFTVVAA